VSDWDEPLDWGDVDVGALLEEFLAGWTIQEILDDHPGLRVGDLIRALRQADIPPPAGWETWGFTMEEWRDHYLDDEVMTHDIEERVWYCDGVEVFDFFGGVDLPIFHTSYTSNGTGGGAYHLVATWGGGGFPATGDDGTIQNGDVVTQSRANEAIFWMDIQNGGSFVMDTSINPNSCTLTFDDTSGAGFKASAGQFNGLGSVYYDCLVTQSLPPVSNPWDASTTIDWIADYTTFEYMEKFQVPSGSSIDCDNCEWKYNNSGTCCQIQSGATLTSFTSNTIDNANGTRACSINVATTAVTDLVITNNNTSVDLNANDVKVELQSSDFDADKVDLNSTGIVLSVDHNSASGEYDLVVAEGDTVLYSELGTGPSTTENLTLHDEYNASGFGTFTVDQNLQIKSIDIGTNTELKFDAVTDTASRTLTFDDSPNAGFGSSTGKLTTTGSASYGVTITSATTPPTTYWDFMCGFSGVTATYTTYSYFGAGGTKGFDPLTATISIEDSTFSYSNASTSMLDLASATITRFKDNTLDQCTSTACLESPTYTGYDNVVITNNSGTYDVHCPDTQASFVDSNFDATACLCDDTGWIYSKGHNDTSTDYEVILAYADTVATSEFPSIWGTGDDVTIRPEVGSGSDATLNQSQTNQVVKTYDIKDDIKYEIDAVTATSAMTLKFDDSAGAGFGSSAGHLVGVGNGSYAVTVSTNAGGAPTNYWDFDTNLSLTADYTTFSYYETGVFTGWWDVDNCTFTETKDQAVIGGNYGIHWESTVTCNSFTNTNLTNCEKTAFESEIDADGLDNIVITGSTLDVRAVNVLLEFENSNFDRTSTACRGWGLGSGTGVIASKDHNDQAGQFYLIIADGYSGSNANYSSLATEPDSDDDIYFWLEPTGTSCTWTFDETGKSTGHWYIEAGKAVTIDVTCADLDVDGGGDELYIIDVANGANVTFDATTAGADCLLMFQSNSNASISTTGTGIFGTTGDSSYQCYIYEKGVAYTTAPTNGIDISGDINLTWTYAYHMNSVLAESGDDMNLVDSLYMFDLTEYGSDVPQEIEHSASWQTMRSTIRPYGRKTWYIKPDDNSTFSIWASRFDWCCPSIYGTNLAGSSIFVQFFDLPLKLKPTYPTRVDPGGADYIGGEDFRDVTHSTNYLLKCTVDIVHSRDSTKYDHPTGYHYGLMALQDILRNSAYNGKTMVIWNGGAFDGATLEEVDTEEVPGVDFEVGWQNINFIVKGDTVFS